MNNHYTYFMNVTQVGKSPCFEKHSQRLFWVILFVLAQVDVWAGGIRGVVKTIKGEPLAYAAVAIKGTNIGTMANAEGRYELTLDAGKYDVVFQYLGFKNTLKTIEVGSGFVTLDAVLEEQALNLGEVRVGSNKEDAAYTIMRRAIAKSRFHALQVDAYNARAYIKFTAVATKIPKLIEKMADLEKQGVKQGRPLINESVTEVSFKQPNVYKQRVISTRNSLDNGAPSPNQFFMSSFYSPEVGGVVSPLSPKAFSYYKFEYLGSFEEAGMEINKIKVIPRAYGEGVFKGQIYIIENTWAIHSLRLTTVVQAMQAFDLEMTQVYTPLQGVWMPSHQQYFFKGSFLGIEGEAKYVVSVRYNSLKVNPAFREEVKVLDEKFDKPSTNLSKSDLRTKKLNDLAKEQKEIGTKQLRQMMKEYEKQERKQRKANKEDVNVVRNDSIVVDSMANKRDDAFWNDIRTIPLTNIETQSYQYSDSIRVVKELKVKVDSTKAKKDSSQVSFSNILLGNTYKLSKKWSLSHETPLGAGNATYNTVEGYTLVGLLNLRYRPNKDNSFYISPLGRYALGRKVFSGTVSAGWNGLRRGVSVTGGQYVAQFNANNPITPIMNTITSLFFEQNFMKIYEKHFGRIDFYYNRVADVLNFSGNVEWAERNTLKNWENAKPWVDWKKRDFTPNAPALANQEPNVILPHSALLLNLALAWRPGQKYLIRNGQKRYLFNNNPTLTLRYAKGLAIGNSDVNFDRLELNLRQNVETGIRSELHYDLTAGAFLNDQSVYVMDYKHFMGNEFFLQMGDAYRTFRALPYYQHSTRQRYLEAHVVNESRRLLLTRIPLVRMAGLKENLMLHYLHTPSLRHYAEVGYGLDGLLAPFPLFRVEVVSIFENFKYQDTVFRVGTTLKFGN